MLRLRCITPKVLRSFQYCSFSPGYLRACRTESTESCQLSEPKDGRFNFINIQMLSRALHGQIFGEEASKNMDESVLSKVKEHLKIHDIWGSKTSTMPDVDFKLPDLMGSNISEHFWNIGEELSTNYKDLLLKLTDYSLPPLPADWKLLSGWTCYSKEGEITSVPYPDDSALVFDVEVCVQEGNYPTLATAVSKNNWYLWCSKRLAEDHFAWSDGISLSDLIPLETSEAEVHPKKPDAKLVVGHNIAFDRTFVKEQYLLEGTRCYFLDTLSLHMCVSGLTGLQRAMSIASKRETLKHENGDMLDLPFGWSDRSSLNNLADVYSLYCDGAVLEKTEREVFVTGTIADIKKRFQELATYCAHDVKATHEVLKQITPMFFERFPHPVTFAGLLEMSTVYLPTNQCWERYLRDTKDTYSDLQKELKLSLMHLANDACSLLHGNMYKNDPWLWNLDWSVQEVKFRKTTPVSQAKKKRKVKSSDGGPKESDVIPHVTPTHEKSEDAEEDILAEPEKTTDITKDPTMKHIYETAAQLRKVRPFLPGYPAWYRDLCDKNKAGKPDWEPGPSLISSQMRCVPKLMRLTWDGYPLHYDAKHGWGYLVPNVQEAVVAEADGFPLSYLLELYSKNEKCSENTSSVTSCDPNWSLLKEPKENPQEEASYWKSILHKSDDCDKPSEERTEHYGVCPYDVGIEGCLFYRLPHKDGPHKRVGNPLSKDFLPKVEDKTLRSWGKGQADKALFLSKMLSYWKNSHQRIVSQMVVWLAKEELNETVTSNPSFDESNHYGAILPRLIPAGTVTRRAVEPTWLTASNAYTDRVGSELKCMIQTPPGYHFVGADVDSQELWIAAVLGDTQFAKIHGCTAFGWMTLQGKKSAGTDMHSRVAKSVGVTRNQAKILNYARIYGAGKAFAQRLLMQFNHRLSPEEARMKVKKIYAETKGTKKLALFEKVPCEDDDSPLLSHKKIWVGGSESYLFNKLEEIAVSSKPRTPVLNCCISRALEPKAVDSNFMTSRINWVVQSSAVDYLHLMLCSMKWLFKHYGIDGRLSICIHDEVHFLVNSKDRYRAALALQITNLWTRSLFAFELGMNDLPQSVAFFTSVDIDLALRKEVDMDAVTPSNPHGLEKGYGIPRGEALDIYDILRKTNNGHLEDPAN